METRFHHGYGADIVCMNFSKQSDHLATADADNTVRVLNAKNGGVTHCFKYPTFYSDLHVQSLSFDAEGENLFVSGGGDLHVRNLRDKKLSKVRPAAQIIAIGMQGKELLFLDQLKKIYTYNDVTGSLVEKMSIIRGSQNPYRIGINEVPQKGTFSQDGRMLLIEKNFPPSVRLFRADSEKFAFMKAFSGKFAALSPDGKTLGMWLSEDGRFVQLFDVSSGTMLQEVRARAVRFSPSNNPLVASLADIQGYTRESDERKSELSAAQKFRDAPEQRIGSRRCPCNGCVVL